MTATDVRAQTIDEALMGTFPASDPPAWTPVMARPAPAAAPDAAAGGDARGSRLQHEGPRHAPERPTVLQALTSLVGATGVVLLFPIAILAVGAALALPIRALLAAARWLTGALG